ncbi:hypothetical protein BaRGS_00011502 [Batillaria attramentaria]|uniref:SGNH hydrolase-type esterase domain-containing protein n=1 Tax=Batillaria attramentaria TaxID=370345 RepID=A0ABD0LD83_9CAEN
MFTEQVCRKWLDRDVVGCNGKVEMKFLKQSRYQDANVVHGAVQTLRQNPNRRSIVVLATGLHDNLNFRAMQQKVLLPLLRNRTREELSRPRLVWMSVPCPGLLKNGNQRQGRENVLRFNREMARFLRTWHVPVLERFNMTDGVMSFDGTHFGLGLNRAAAQVILYYLRELRLKRLW